MYETSKYNKFIFKNFDQKIDKLNRIQNFGNIYIYL